MMNTSMTDLLAQVSNGRADTPYTVSADWGQGRATFGGLLGGMIYTAMRREVDSARALYSFMLSFVGPVAMSEPFTITVSTLRTGRSAIQMEAKVWQNEQVMCAALACFCTARSSKVHVTPSAAPLAPLPDTLPALPYIPNITPAFSQHIDFRWAFGGLPFCNMPSLDMGGWMKLSGFESNEEMTVAHLITLIDAWPPAVLPHLAKPAPASSMTWNIAFMHPMPKLTHDWLLYRAHIDQAADGYGQTHAHVWNAQGELLAISSQTVAVFDVD
jgi:acyl-CoA thioesterase